MKNFDFINDLLNYKFILYTSVFSDKVYSIKKNSTKTEKTSRMAAIFRL